MLMVGLKQSFNFPSVAGDEIGDFFEVSTIRREVRLVDLYRMSYSFAPLICAPIL